MRKQRGEFGGLTAELKQRARALAKGNEDVIRARAREIWEESGRPAGRDEEFWFQAEREFREAEALRRHGVHGQDDCGAGRKQS